ncbi:MAG: peptide chain release factor N(5)-glutamine methyltransferase [Paraprevotella sp.]|nr:peptide chain release factor N(5)-glutamine methyltransferase [Paraprevotella sp.]
MFQLIRQISDRLLSVYPEREAYAIARHLLEVRFGINQTDLCLGKVKQFSLEERNEIENIIQRLLQHEPIQYILEQADFYGHSFLVTKDVLIPRPETEELVDWVINSMRSKSTPLNVLDIGTGSGCIAISIAKELPGTAVTAFDVSEKAILIAQQNAKRLQTNITFQLTDILAKVGDNTEQCKWDVIISNPPYICLSEQGNMEKNVLAHEPHLALFVPDDDPLLFYRSIARYAQQRLNPNGELFFEINRQYGKEVCQLLDELNFTDITLKKDIYDNDRMIKCTKKKK